MRLRLPILLLLLFSRVFITPVWYSFNTSSVSNHEHVFENIRLKKRRCSYVEERADAAMSIVESEEAKATPRITKFIKSFLTKQAYNQVLSLIGTCCIQFNHPIYQRFLRNRALLI
ncbi:hypothetical protein ACI6Q2_07910 [Chitinophagaceae bacterium LWZ2-11]